ncbi:MAG TPA: hypothetical protein VF546_14085 [Pyrinomonadaceae bacterium]|jgi:hypothetical protein
MSKSTRHTSLAVLLFVSAAACARVRAQTPPAPQPSSTPSPAADATAQPSPTPSPQLKPDDITLWYAAPPLTPRQKMKRAARSAFLSPVPYAFAATGALITEARERDQPHKDSGDRFADGLSRFAINFATRSTGTMFSSGIYPVLFKQETRYSRSARSGFGPRVLHAARHTFVTYHDGWREESNYSRLAGNLTAAALANIWERDTPGRRRVGVGPTFRRFGYSLVFGMASDIVFKEFWPDIKQNLGGH